MAGRAWYLCLGLTGRIVPCPNPQNHDDKYPIFTTLKGLIMFKLKYSINGVKRWIAPDPVWWAKYGGKVLALVVVLAVVLFVTGCTSGTNDPAPVTSSDVAMLCPSVIEGTVDAPPMIDRVRALAIEAQSKGLTLTGNYANDVAVQGGEMMLIGTSFKFVFDPTCQIDKSQSHLNLFLTNYPVEGGMELNGNLGMAVDVGGAKVGIKGRVVNGQFVEGEVRKGWLPHIYGVLNGAYKSVVK